MKRDKIFNNKFYENEGKAGKQISFKLADAVDEDMPTQIEDNSLDGDIHRIVNNLKDNKFSSKNEDGTFIKLNKKLINEIYGIVVEEIGHKYKKIKLYIKVADYFNVQYSKFYNSLSNKYKEDLIEELDKKTGVLKKMGINKLF